MDAPRHFFIIGAQKAGTTSLYHYLSTHPDIFASEPKETKFFCNAERTHKHPEPYDHFFKGRTSQKWTFEASPHYTQFPKYVGIPERIHAAFPDARLIYILRHPVERVFSHYLFRTASPSGREDKAFFDALAGNPVYIDTSSYYLQISKYLPFFSRDRFLILQLDDLRRDPKATLRRVFEFLDVDPTFVPPNADVLYNETKDRPTMVAPFVHRLEETSWYTHVPWQIRHWLRRRFRTEAPKKTEVFTPDAYNHVHRLLADDVARLKEFLGHDLPWDFPKSRHS